MKSLPILAAVALSLTLAACDNPADSTPTAQVSEATQVVAAAATADSKTYTFTENSTVGFVGSKVTGSHEGGFKKISGEFTVQDGTLAGSGHTIAIDMQSAWADHPKLLEHLKSEDFFNVSQFPESTFEVTSLEKGQTNSFTVSGNLTLHGVTKNITFPATVSETDNLVAIKAEFDISRKDFGIVYPGKKDDLIRDEVVIKLDLKATPSN